MTIHNQKLLQRPEQESSYWVLGDLYRFKAVGEETGQAYALCEIVVQPQSGTPLHSHSREDEAFYVLSGEFEFQLNQQTVVATAGTFLHSPKGQLHRFTNVGTTPARMLFWLTPAGLEKFFAEVGVPTDGRSPAPVVTLADIEKVMAIAPHYGVEIVPA